MKTTSVMTFVVFSFLFLFSCGGQAVKANADTTAAAKQPPVWVNNPSKKDAENLYTVGYVEDTGALEDVKQKALQNAKGKIANTIFEESSVSKVFETSGSLNSDQDLTKIYKESVKSESAVHLVGVEASDYYVEETNDSGLTVYKVWVLAKISNKNLESERNRILSEIQRKLALVDNNLKQADSFAQAGKASDAVNSFIEAAISSTQVKERADEFPIYITRADKVLDGISIDPVLSPDTIDTGKGGKFSFKVSYNNGTSEIPASGIKINFIIRNNDGDFTRSAVSDLTGTVVCTVKTLKEVRTDNLLYANLSLDMDSVLNLGKDYQNYYSTLSDSIAKVTAHSGFKTLSAENRNIPTTVIAMLNQDGDLSPIPNLASEAQSQLLTKGYKVVKFSDTVSLGDIYQAKSSALSILAEKGIKRVFVLYVNSEEKPKYNEDLSRYLANYSVSAQLIDTTTGEILSAKNIKLNATSPQEKGVFESFIKAAGKELSRLIE